jgi:nucleotide-binding universal stress UspA family protein
MDGHPKNIFLAVDGSEHSWAAVKLLQDLPAGRTLPDGTQKPASAITVLTVLLPRNASDYASRMQLLEKTQAVLQDTGYCVQAELLVGYPAEMLVEYAEQHKPDLIVLGAMGQRATLGILLGGVAQQLVEYACCPILIVRAPYHGLKRILVVVDGSPSSLNAAEFLGEFPLPANAEITIVHVLPPLYQPGYDIPQYVFGTETYIPSAPMAMKDWLALQKAEEYAGMELLDSVRGSLESRGLKSNPALLRGDAATEIIEFARQHQEDLIVCGSRGLSQMRGWLLGSVSRKLVHYANCSTLVVKTTPKSDIWN